MTKFKLTPDPTFSAPVSIPVHGGDPVSVSFTFKHRTRDELETFMKAAPDLRDAAFIMEMASGWELSDAFTAENLNLFAQNYITAPRAVFDAYLSELIKAREKN